MCINIIDFEVFLKDWLCVINNPVEKTKTIIVNNADELQAYYNTHKHEIFVGHNIKGYDQFIFKGILLGFDPKAINDFIIRDGQQGFNFSRDFNKIPLNIFDTKLNDGLKSLECFMGDSIEESTVPFNLDRKMNAQELAEVIKYCEHDVEETLKVFLINKAEFDSIIELIDTFNLPFNYIQKTKAQLSSIILDAEYKKHDDEFCFDLPNNLQINKYNFVVDWYKDPANFDYTKKLECEIASVPHVFAWGGLHGAIPQYNDSGYFVNVDVASYYPSLMIEYDLMSRNVKDRNKYKEIYHKRLEYKKLKDKRQAPLKIVLNSTYGALKDKNNTLYDPRRANEVCIFGMLFLLDLIEKLEPYFDIIQSNTDGILVKLRASNEEQADAEYKRLDNICYEWETRTKMQLEFDEFKKVVQKDVNNYVIIDANNKYKSKGAYVKKLSELDNDLPIVNKAMIEFIINNKPVEETINECTDLKMFQKLVKLGSKFEFIMHGDKKLNEKYLRVFASNYFELGQVYKCKYVDNTLKKNKVPNTPANAFIYNGDVNELKTTDRLDKQWYINLTNERLEQFGYTKQLKLNI